MSNLSPTFPKVTDRYHPKAAQQGTDTDGEQGQWIRWTSLNETKTGDRPRERF